MTKKQRTERINEDILLTIKRQKPETVDQLVEMIRRQNNSLTKQEILDLVLKLQREGRIALREILTPTPQRITKYLCTPGAYWYSATIAFTVMAIIVVFTIPEDAYLLVYIRYLLGTIFVLWLPGYCFIKALFPMSVPVKTPTKSLDYVERISLSIGMSLALVTVVGLFLNYTPWGIRLPTIVTSLLACTVVLATVAIVREHQAKAKMAHRQLIKAQNA